MKKVFDKILENKEIYVFTAFKSGERGSNFDPFN